MNRNSEVIHILRFPLALLVVLLHAEPSITGWSPQNMTSEYTNANIVGVVMYSLSHILAQIAVPTFFLISGYLFFLKLERWDTKLWKRKLLSRFSSIVVPYLIVITIFSAKHIFSHYENGDLDSWLTSQGGLLNLFWASEKWRAGQYNVFGQPVFMTGPIAYHLWFLRDLIVSVLCTPILYMMFAMKNGEHTRYSLFCLVLLGLFDLTRVQLPTPGLSCSTLFYFGLGSFLSLNKYDLWSAFYRSRKTFLIAFVFIYLCLIPFDGSRSQWGTIIMPFENLIGAICIINCAAYCTMSNLSLKIFHKYEKTSFFMFIIHPFFLAVVWSVLSLFIRHLYGQTDISRVEFVNSHPVLTLSLFSAKIAIAAVLSILTYHAITKISPRLSKLICGR